MINNNKILCIVLARGGSKGLKDKNIYPLNGISLISYTLEHCLNSKYIDKVVVSTDCPKIKEEALKYCEVITRPDEISKDNSPSEEALIHAINNLKEEYDFIVCPQITHPVRRIGLIDKCIKKCIKGNFDSLLTVKSFSPFFLHINDDNKIYFNDKTQIINRKMRQDFNKSELFYYDMGNLYISKVKELLRRKDRIGINPTIFELKEEECIDIHTKTDIKLACSVLKQHYKTIYI